MTGRIEMVFTENENEEKTEMDCKIEIHNFTKADLCKMIALLSGHLNLTKNDWKIWQIHNAVKAVLADVDEMREKGMSFEEWLKNETSN